MGDVVILVYPDRTLRVFVGGSPFHTVELSEEDALSMAEKLIRAAKNPEPEIP